MTRYELAYWPIPFRGHFIRFALATAGADWEELDFDAVAALKDEDVAAQPYPFVAPPLLIDRETGARLSQMPAILMALGRRHGLLADEDKTLRLIADANDVLFEITRYHGALMWDAGSWAAFEAERLPRWMRVHDRLCRDAGVTAAAGWVCGARMTLADLVLCALWHTMADRLPPLRAVLEREAPAMAGLVDRVAATPGVAGVIADWRDSDARYCGGQIEASLCDVLGLEVG